MARTEGYYSLANKAKALIDSDMVVVPKAGDSNIDLRLAVSGHDFQAKFGWQAEDQGIRECPHQTRNAIVELQVRATPSLGPTGFLTGPVPQKPRRSQSQTQRMGGLLQLQQTT